MPQFIGPQFQRDPYWDIDLYHQEKLEFKHSSDKSLEQTDEYDIFTDSHKSDKLRYALIDKWTVNPQQPNTSTLPKIRPRPIFKKCQNPVIDIEFIPQLSISSWQKHESPTVTDKHPIEKLYSLMVFGELTMTALLLQEHS